jgi:endonuclease YncB( thermonuclease family)
MDKANLPTQGRPRGILRGILRGIPRRAAEAARRPGWVGFLALAALFVGGIVGGVVGGAPGALGAGDRLAGPLSAQVVSVLDGDTLEVRVHIWLGQDIRTRVRLAGIDAPELKGKCARERDLAQRARAYLLARLDPLDAGAAGDGDAGDGDAGDGAAGDGAAASIRLREVRYGKYAGRVLARVETLDGTDLGQELVAAGLARPYDGRRRASWCEAAATAGSG